MTGAGAMFVAYA